MPAPRATVMPNSREKSFDVAGKAIRPDRERALTRAIL
jgi:hypothetical protein